VFHGISLSNKASYNGTLFIVITGTLIGYNLPYHSAFPELIAMYSAELLHKRITGFDDEPQRIILKPELVVRESCSGWTGQNRGN
jgi:hypothetical protein